MLEKGVIPFVRFMELALYCPVYGYYEKEKDIIGRRGDFLTSVSVGDLFGELLAFQFAEWLQPEVGSGTSEARIVEAGAHDGQLANDVLTWLRDRRAELFRQIEYSIVEPSAQRRKWQEKTLAPFHGRIRWVTQLSDLNLNPKSPGVCGIIFANELLDAMPVHRIGWDAARKKWFEWGVGLDGEEFVPVKMRDLESRIRPPRLPDGLLEVLPDGFTTELCPAAEAWWGEAGGLLRRGRLMTIDYGLAEEDFFTPGRKEGTLRAYRGHQPVSNMLADPGAQDITAHVNFSAIQAAGEAAGLRTEAFVRQANFLTQIAGRVWTHETDFVAWTAARTRQFQTLTHPEHLGRPFRVLIQSRSVGG